jgi:hypothetical protein
MRPDDQNSPGAGRDRLERNQTRMNAITHEQAKQSGSKHRQTGSAPMLIRYAGISVHVSITNELTRNTGSDLSET